MGRDDDEERLDELEQDVLDAFARAYPEMPPDERKHMARNFTQVLHGIISIGERVGSGGEANHMDLANGMVYSCFANTTLEELVSDDCSDSGGSCISRQDMNVILRECAGRVADWLLGIEILKRTDGKLYDSFAKGAVALGAQGWERNRGRLEH